MAIDPNNARHALGFPQAVRRSFAFLADHGLCEVASESTIVRFESDVVLANVYHGRSSYEIGFEVGPRVPGATSYSLGELVRLASPADGAKYRYPAATTTEGVAQYVAEVAEIAKRVSTLVLRGDAATFSSLGDQRRVWSREYAASMRYSQVLPKAEEAFRAGDWYKAATLYEEIAASLTPVQRAKHEHARKRAAAG